MARGVSSPLMIENAFFVPLLPGKSDAARFFAQTMSGPRRAELDQALADAGYTEPTPIQERAIRRQFW